MNECLAALAQLGEVSATKNMPFVVLSGYDPVDSSTGRDLDVFVPRVKDARALSQEFARILEAMGFRYVFSVNPIWGFRTIGISRDFTYVELHIITRVKVMSVPVSSLFDLRPRRSQDGVSFDPLFMFFKQFLIKRNRLIFKRARLHFTDSEKNFLQRFAHDIDLRLGETWSQLLLDQADSVYDVRRRALLAFLKKSFSHPLQAMSGVISELLKTRVSMYFSPCVPLFFLNCDSSYEELDRLCEKLQAKLGHIFLEVILVRPGKLRRKEVRRLQSRQCLVVFCDRKLPQEANTLLGRSCHLNNGRFYDPERDEKYVLEEIIQNFASFNEAWNY